MQLVAFGDRPTFEMREVPEPQPGPGEVVVSLKAAALNRRDPWIWTSPGYCPLPVTMGSDGAGVVRAVGPEVSGLALGDEVVIYPTLGWEAGKDVPGPEFDILGAPSAGTFADAVLVSASNLRHRPRRLGWAESGAFPLSGLTAWRAVHTCGRVREGTTVLVSGAGSGVSTFVLQIAVAAGARVTVTTGTPAKAAAARALGASGAVLYTDPDWPEQVRDLAGPLDVVIDSYGDDVLTRGLALLRRGGRYVSYGDTAGPSATVEVADVYWEWRSVIGTSMGSPEEFAALVSHLEVGDWRPVVDSVFPLGELPAAADRLASKERFGKVVIAVDEAVTAA